jgi:predicted DNA-binding transcriptional regulator AlpA
MSAQMIKRPMLRTPEASSYTGLAKATLERFRVRGGGPRFVKVGAAVMYDPCDLDAWLEQHKRASTSDAPASTVAA